MSLMSMRRKMASKKTATYILWALIVAFLGGVALWSVPGGSAKNTGANGGYSGNSQYAETIIAKINGDKVTLGQLDEEFYNLQTKYRTQFDLRSAQQARQMAFDTIVKNTVSNQIIDDMGIHTWSWTLNRIANELAQSQLVGMRIKAEDQAKQQADSTDKAKGNEKPLSVDQIYDQLVAEAAGKFIKKAKPTEKDYIQSFVDMVKSQDEQTGKYNQLLEFARTYLVGMNAVKDLPTSPQSEDFAKKFYTKEVKASWIFVAAKDTSKTGLAEAQKKATKLHDDVAKSPQTFANIAKKDSDDFMTKMKGGDLDWINAQSSNVLPMAMYLAYIQKENEIGPVVAVAMPNPFGGPSQMGYGFLKVDGIRDRAAAKDTKWETVKVGAMALAKIVIVQGIGGNYMETKRASADIDRLSNELKYYDAQSKNPSTAEALSKKLQDDKTIPPVVAASFKYQLAEKMTDPSSRAAALEGVLSYAGSQVLSIQIELGKAYAEAGKKDLALQQLNYVADGASTSDEDQSIHKQLQTEYTKLGEAQRAQDMAKWIKDHPKPPTNPGDGGLSVTPQQ